MPNHLSKETSPYLLQHADNPVDWYPWGPDALEKARKENKPILLSIGYAACHWCHVMAHESFEDAETAKVMNEYFINIKVDREERPDLDKIYQTTHFLLTQRSGGWPLTIFLTPHDLTPFFSGTYFPAEARYQLPAFKDLLRMLADVYKNQSDNIAKQNQELKRIVHSQPTTLTTIQLTHEPIERALTALHDNYDAIYGGFGGAPKFPHPTAIEFLLTEKSSMATSTLYHMAEGGIYDQLQGGFFRYSVDEKWRIPHFEKMLYDNALLMDSYAMAAKERDEKYFAEITRQTANWALNIMQSPEGGFYSSLDADSEGHEGKFYAWNRQDIESLLTNEENLVARKYFGLDQPANFEDQWHLYLTQPADHPLMPTIKQKLLTARELRVHPHCDKKILTAWNALMIKSLATASDALQDPRLLHAAEKALAFIRENLWVNNRLYASYKDNVVKHPAYLDDYAFLLEALMTLLQIKSNENYFNFAQQLADTLLTYFYDKEMGGFFFTASDHEKLLYRPKIFADESLPSGNGAAVRALITLGKLSGEKRYQEAAEKTLQVAWPALMRFPAEHCSLLLGLKDFVAPLSRAI